MKILSTKNEIVIPIWQGVVDKAKPPSSSPIALASTSQGMWMQPYHTRVELGYNKDSYSFITPPPGSSAYASALSDSLYSFIKDRYMPTLQNQSLLEVGSGSTSFSQRLLSAFPEINHATIVDPAISTNEIGLTAGPNITFKIRKQFFDEFFIASTGKCFNLVVCANTLEHVDDPKSFLLKLRSFLDKDTNIFFEFPIIDRELQMCDINMLLHEHISYFTTQGALSFFKDSGYQVIDYSLTENGGILIYCQLSRKGNKDSQSFSLSTKASPVSYYDLNSFIGATESFTGRVHEVAKNGKVAIWGATNGLNSSLFLDSHGVSEKICVFDVDPQKTGKFLPMLDIPIRNSCLLIPGEFNHVFIAAMNFCKEIRRTLIKRGFKQENIHFIC